MREIVQALGLCQLAASYHLSTDKPKALEEFLTSLTVLNPGFVKLFQSLALQTSFITPAQAAVIERFTDDVPYTEEENRLVRPVAGERLTDVSPIPIRSGTVALIYSCKFAGKDSVYKAYRPDIKEKLRESNNVLLMLARLLSPFSSYACEVRECLLVQKDCVVNQCSGSTEIENLRLFRRLCDSSFPTIKVPEVYCELGESGFVMEQAKGVRVDELKPSRRVSVADTLLEFMTSQPVQHADIHLGNVLVDGERIWLLDLAMVSKDTAAFELFGGQHSLLARSTFEDCSINEECVKRYKDWLVGPSGSLESACSRLQLIVESLRTSLTEDGRDLGQAIQAVTLSLRNPPFPTSSYVVLLSICKSLMFLTYLYGEQRILRTKIVTALIDRKIETDLGDPVPLVLQ